MYYDWISYTSPKPIVFLPYDCSFEGDCLFHPHKEVPGYDGAMGWYCFSELNQHAYWTFKASIAFHRNEAQVLFTDDDDYWLMFVKEDSTLEYAKQVASWLNNLAYFDLNFFYGKLRGWDSTR